MKYSTKINLFLAENTELVNDQKAEEVAKLEIDDLFDLMRNVEEAPHKYDRAIIRSVISALNSKNIYCC